MTKQSFSQVLSYQAWLKTWVAYDHASARAQSDGTPDYNAVCWVVPPPQDLPRGRFRYHDVVYEVVVTIPVGSYYLVRAVLDPELGTWHEVG